MKPSRKENETIRQDFIRFYDECKKNPKVLTVFQAAENVNADFGKIRKWALSKSGFNDDMFLNMSSFICCTNIGHSYNNNEISKLEAEKALKINGIPVDQLTYFQKRAEERIKNQINHKKFCSLCKKNEPCEIQFEG